jgi:competence protein ComEC
MPLLLSFFSGNVLFFSSRFFPFSSLVLFLAAAYLLIRGKKAAMVPVIVLGFLMVLLRMPVTEKAPYGNRLMEVKGRFLRTDNAPAPGADMQPFVIDQAYDEETGEEIDDLEDGKIWVRSQEEVDPEETYDLLIRTGKDRTRLNPGSPGKPPFYATVKEVRAHEEGRRFLAGAFEGYRQSLNSYIERRFSRHTADFVAAVTIGGTQMDGGLKKAFNAAGLAHILSISGTHFGLFSVVIFACVVFLFKRLPYRLLQRMTLYMSPAQAAAVICMPLMVFYLGISGGSLPAVRSFIMVSLFLAGLLLGRKGAWLTAVLLAAVLLILWDPEVVLSLSFQLSFLAVLFIGFAVEDKVDAEKPGKTGSRPYLFIKNSLRLTLAATIGTAPLVAYYFHYLSLISPVANLLIAPLIGFIVIPLALVSSFSYLLTGVYLFAPLVSASADISLRLVRTMAGVPFADIAVPAFPPVLILLFYASFLIFLALEKKRALLVLPFVPFLIYLLVVLVSPRQLSVTFLDVGQGDSAVVELPDGKAMVIDTGRTGHETATFLQYLGKRRIDLLLLTHPHPDHAGGRDHLLHQFRVAAAWDNGMAEYPGGDALPERREIVGRGDMVRRPDYMLQVFHPYEEFTTPEDDEYSAGNNSSLVLRVSGRAHSFLFCGDIEEEAEDDLLHLGAHLRSDVIKVPHHGGKTSVHEGLFDAVSPALAVISVGRENVFGHPSAEMLGALTGVKTYRTDRDGAIKITETARGLTVKTFREYQLQKAGSLGTEMQNIRRLFRSW